MTTPLEVSPLDYHQRLKLDRSNVFSADSWLSKSRLWELNSCSLAKWRFFPREVTPTAAMQWGSLIDCYITTPDMVDSMVVYNPFADCRTKAAQELRDSTLADGKIFISAEQRKEVEIASERVHSHPIAGPVVASCRKQVVLLNRLSGINFKGLVDLAPVSSPCLYDFKTTASISSHAIAKSISDFGYHVQAALYLKLWNLCNPDDQRSRFRFIWQESSAPYEVAVTELPSFDINAGEEWAAHQIGRIIAATEANDWPGAFGDKVAMIGRPGYAAYQDEEAIDGHVEAPIL